MLYKILDTKTGLYSSGGYYPSWAEDGKTFKTIAQVKSSLKLYCRGEPVRGLQYQTKKVQEAEARRRKRQIPKSWKIVTFSIRIVKSQAASELV